MASSENRSIFSRTWSRFWQIVDGTRRIILNIVFLVILIFVIQVITRGGEELIIKADTTLIVKPIGSVVEQYSGYPFDRALASWTGEPPRETQLRDILQALSVAQEDPRISQVLIDSSSLASVGMANLQEISQAVEDFRASGKKVIAMGDFYSEDRYYLASLADEIWLDPQGTIWFDGFAYYRNYYREGLDKLAVDVHLFRVGTYKSAIEPFIRDDMSAADREASQYLINDIWNNYLSAIALHRGLPAEVLNDLTQNYAQKIVEADGNSAQLALDMGLVDRLITWPEARAELAQNGASDDDEGYRQVEMQDYLRQQRSIPNVPGPRVGVVVAEGSITGGSQPPGTIGADSLARLLREANNDDDIKAVVLRVNSPGGSALASEVIRREMELLNESGKPVVVSMGNVAASGGYWISMGAAEVWANPSTITGSIGIFGVFPTFDRTLDKIGIHTDGVGTTPLSGGLRPDRPLQPAAEQMIQSFIERGYQDFLQLVSKYRDLSIDEVDQVAQGRVWTGGQALERHLVDQSGGIQDAINAAAHHAGLGDNYQVHYVEEELTGFESILAEAGSQALISVGIEPPQSQVLSALNGGAGAASLVSRHPALARAQQELSLLLSQSDRPQSLAHCFCTIP
jgi:protease-4